MMKRIYSLFLFLIFSSILINAEIRFNPLCITKENIFLFNSEESIGGNDTVKTLFLGKLKGEAGDFESLSFYPENLYFNERSNKLFIENRIGLYTYDLNKNIISPIEIYPGFTKKDEFVIYRPQKAGISPNSRFVIGKVPTSPTKSSIFLYDTQDNTADEIVKDVETTPGIQAGLWSEDSNYFIYQKNNNIYYFSINDYKNGKLLNEKWRWIGKVNLTNTFWTKDNNLIWIEENIIYKADPNQFFYRSIYKNYLRQGDIVGKIPFIIDNAFDSFVYNDSAKKFIIAKDGSSIFYYSLTNDLKENPYIQINDNMRFDSCSLFNTGEGIVSVKILSGGKVNKIIILLKKSGDEFSFTNFNSIYIQNAEIYGFSKNRDESQFVVNTSKGAYCYDFASLKLLWKYEDEKIISSINTGANDWILGGFYTTLKYDGTKFKPLFASSIEDAGFLFGGNEIGLVSNKKNFVVDKNSKTILEYSFTKNDMSKEEKNNKYRILSREINKGFYKEAFYIKDLYSGNQIEITGLPKLRYKLYQPELVLDANYYSSPDPQKHEVSLVFNCIKTGEGIFPILTALSNFKINASFFINGNFMDINPAITREIGNFNFEVGNMFQYYVNLTDNNFLIDKNFIRQGLSSNEEKFYKLSGKNFSPYWHTPFYAQNETIIKYGLDNGYKFVSYQLDSFDWISENNRELDRKYYMNNSELIDRILHNLLPGEIIVFSAGKNYIKRDDWLFNDLDLLISELVRAGYYFEKASVISERYRVK
jgi:peptidoglycan/xylan/chitin deacetylase (PgdA/CDA1 family)